MRAASAVLGTLLAAAASGAGESAPPPPDPRPAGFRFAGYLRSGYGVSGEGTAQEAFAAPNAGAKLRLGNETEAYVETTFAYGVAPAEDSSFFDTRVTVSYVTPTSRSGAFDTTVSLREAWALGRGVLGSQPEATFWAGSRYYDRHDLHLYDFYYRDLSGFGGGVEGLRAGRARIAAAWLGGSVDRLAPNGTVVPAGQFQLNKNTLDVRVDDLGLAGGKLALAVDVSTFHGDTVSVGADEYRIRDDTGWSAALVHERPLAQGRNKLSIQYGTGVASDFRAVLTRPPGRTFAPGEVVDLGGQWRFSVVEDLALERLGPFSLLAGGIWQEIDNGAAGGNRLRWLALGLRPTWHLDRHFSVQLEAGIDHTRQDDGPRGSLFKVTLAPQLTPRVGALQRPSLRAYVTWARWSEGFVSLVAPINYATARQGLGAGVQLETWW